MDVFKILNDNGKIETVPAAQFPLSEKQQVLVIGVTFSIQDCKVKSATGIEAKLLGRLSDQELNLKCKIIDGLLHYRWDMQKWPDPTVILMTDNRFNAQLN